MLTFCCFSTIILGKAHRKRTRRRKEGKTIKIPKEGERVQGGADRPQGGGGQGGQEGGNCRGQQDQGHKGEEIQESEETQGEVR